MRVLKRGDQFVDGAREVFVRGEAWENMVVGEEANSFALVDTAGVGAPYVKTGVVFWGASGVPSF